MGNGDAGKRTQIGFGHGRGGALVLLPVLALLLAGCAGGGIGGGGGNEGPMGSGDAGNQGLFGSTMQTTTVSPTAAASNAGGTPAGTAAVTPGDFDASQFTCPPIQVRGGAAAWQVTDPQDGAVRYQATLGQFSRECRFTAPDMNIRVGIQGRVLLGAKGGPGKLTVPIRLAVVEEGPEPKSVWTKFYSVPVEIGPGVMQVDFGIVADDVNFPRPTPAVSERYVIYVGFDPQGAQEKPQRARPATQARPRPQTQPSAQPQAQRPRPAAPAATAAPAPVQTAPAAAAPVIRTAPATPAPAATAPAASAPAASPSAPMTAPAASAPAAKPDDSQTQWIGAPAPSTGGFSQ